MTRLTVSAEPVCFRCGNPVRPGTPHVKASGNRQAHFGCSMGALGDILDSGGAQVGAAESSDITQPPVAPGMFVRGLQRLGTLIRRAR